MIHHKLQVRNLTFSYPDGQEAIKNMSFDIMPGESVGIIGANGAGKSTLLMLLMGILTSKNGEIIVGEEKLNKKTLSKIREKLGMVFQDPDDQLFMTTVYDDVAFGPLNQGLNRDEAYQIALQQLERLNIVGLKDRSVNTLSGGEQNFTALAGVLAMQPKVLLLDEPTNGLDVKNIAKLTALLRELQLPMLIASHDLRFSETLADSCLSLATDNDG